MNDTTDWTIARMSKIPNCDFCGDKAEYDAKTKFGPWAYMCGTHWHLSGLGQLGLGRGQRLVLETEI